MVPQQNIDIIARTWAINRHHETNHQYDYKSYEVHLWMVYDTAKMFIHHIPEPDKEKVLAACWLHDTIEDCRVTFNVLAKCFGNQVAEIVYALTNEKGRNRKERANKKYYEGIRETPYAEFVKICDRIANVKYSFENQGGMLEKYKQEMAEFRCELDYASQYTAMWELLYSFINN
jgi:(p)ppGpp synthase/HD superfamily hydrolase